MIRSWMAAALVAVEPGLTGPPPHPDSIRSVYLNPSLRDEKESVKSSAAVTAAGTLNLTELLSDIDDVERETDAEWEKREAIERFLRSTENRRVRMQSDLEIAHQMDLFWLGLRARATGSAWITSMNAVEGKVAELAPTEFELEPALGVATAVPSGQLWIGALLRTPLVQTLFLRDTVELSTLLSRDSKSIDDQLIGNRERRGVGVSLDLGATYRFDPLDRSDGPNRSARPRLTMTVRSLGPTQSRFWRTKFYGGPMPPKERPMQLGLAFGLTPRYGPFEFTLRVGIEGESIRAELPTLLRFGASITYREWLEVGAGLYRMLATGGIRMRFGRFSAGLFTIPYAGNSRLPIGSVRTWGVQFAYDD